MIPLDDALVVPVVGLGSGLGAGLLLLGLLGWRGVDVDGDDVYGVRLGLGLAGRRRRERLWADRRGRRWWCWLFDGRAGRRGRRGWGDEAGDGFADGGDVGFGVGEVDAGLVAAVAGC